MNLFELCGCFGLLCGTAAGLIAGWSHSPIFALGGAVLGGLLGWALGVFLAYGLIYLDSPKSSADSRMSQDNPSSETNHRDGSNGNG